MLFRSLAKEKGYEFTDKDPQENYPDELDKYRKEMDENGWDYGQDDEELFELAMHDRQYRDYKSGVAKERFIQELAKAKEEALADKGYTAEDILAIKRAKYEPVTAEVKGQVIWEIDVDADSLAPAVGKEFKPEDNFCYITTSWGEHRPVKANFEGRVIEVTAKQGDRVNKGDVLAYIERTNKEN